MCIRDSGTSDPRLFLDTPSNGSTVQPQFAIAGWSVDLGASSGTGIMAVHAWAFPASGGAPIFVGAANLGASRLDVAGYYNRSQFATSGFNLRGSLPPGTYDIRVSGLSSVAGAFNVAAMTRVTVAAPPSKPRMFVDLPAFNQTVTRTFLVAGWAVDLAASSGTGVDGIHVWAYPAAGGSPIFVGAGTLGVPRSDVAAVFGSGQFGTAGYFVWGTLPPGEYNLIVYAHSTVAGDFNQAAVVHIRVV